MQKEPEILPIKRFSLKIVEPEFIDKHLYKKMCDFTKKQKTFQLCKSLWVLKKYAYHKNHLFWKKKKEPSWFFALFSLVSVRENLWEPQDLLHEETSNRQFILDHFMLDIVIYHLRLSQEVTNHLNKKHLGLVSHGNKGLSFSPSLSRKYPNFHW